MHWIYTKIQKNSNHSTGKMWVLQLLLVVCWSDSNLKKDAFKANTVKRMIWRNNTGFWWKPNETFAKHPNLPCFDTLNFCHEMSSSSYTCRHRSEGPETHRGGCAKGNLPTEWCSMVNFARGRCHMVAGPPFKTVGKLKRVESSFHSCIYSLENWKVPEFFHQKLISGILLGVLPLSVRAANEAIGIRC